MSRSVARTLVLSTAVGAVAMLGALTPAVAKGKHHHHHFRHYHVWHAPVVVRAYDSCDVYRWRWKRTGSRFWKAQYFACIY